MSDLPILGAAMSVADIPEFADWILADQRDLEIQDPCRDGFYEGDTVRVADDARRYLDGYTGRLGVHAVFSGIHLTVSDRVFVKAYQTRLLETRASEIDCKLVLENIFDTDTTPLNTLVSTIDSSYLRRSIDVGHSHLMAQRGGPPADIWVQETGALLEHVHLADNDGMSDRHWRPGLGDIAWHAVFKELGKLEHSPRLILEIAKDTLLPATQWLNEQGLAR
ncbi:MAG: sugar phosphate isomerase/epimerase family protein [Opitutales bacterium]